jgi:hypothetical protein
VSLCGFSALLQCQIDTIESQTFSLRELDTLIIYLKALLASKAVIELELSTTIAKLGLMISKVFSSNYGINQQQDDSKQR